MQDSRRFRAAVLWALSSIAMPAHADITILKQHNAVTASAGAHHHVVSQSFSSDSPASYAAAAHANWYSARGFASVMSTIGVNSLTVGATTTAAGTSDDGYGPESGAGSANTVLQFQVSTTDTYDLSATASLYSRYGGAVGSLTLSGGPKVLTAPFTRQYLLEVGKTYTITASARAYNVPTNEYPGAGYGITITPVAPVAAIVEFMNCCFADPRTRALPNSSSGAPSTPAVTHSRSFDSRRYTTHNLMLKEPDHAF